MPCSPAQLQSNIRNAARSTGPRTPAGRAASCRNSLKHGLTGKGIVLREEDAAEVERRLAALEAELKPTSGIELELVKRIALMTVRLDRSAEPEGGSSHQKGQQAGQRGAAEQQQPVAGVETQDATFGSHTCDHDFLE